MTDAILFSEITGGVGCLQGQVHVGPGRMGKLDLQVETFLCELSVWPWKVHCGLTSQPCFSDHSELLVS